MKTLLDNLLPAFCLLILFGISCKPPAPIETSVNDLGVSILQPAGKKSSVEVINAVLDRVKPKIDALNPLDGDVLGDLNDSEVGELIPMGDVSVVLTECMKYTADCYGAFDATLQILWDVYDFKLGGRFVSDAELAEALPLVDYSKIEIDDGSILRMAENVRMGFGPTISGAVVDLVIDEMNSEGFEWDTIKVGDCEAVSTETTYDFYYPLNEASSDESDLSLMGHIRLSPGEFIAAIDDDELFFFSHGNYYHEVIEPIQGKPVEGVKAAVVVCSESGLQASIFAYAVMVMGEERGIEFLNETEGVEGLVLLEGGRIVVSGGLEDKYWR
ncbi:MAG: FAD:protein FMN transferase [bacterium]|nr:FAD:protein FMN transferase [bacterium]